MNSRRMIPVGLAASAALLLSLGQPGVGAASSRGPSAGHPQRVSLSTASPASASCPMRFSFSLARASNDTLAICDPNGWVVESLIDGPMDAGAHVAVWNGLGENGRPMHGNAYLAVLRADGRIVSQPFVLTASHSARAMEATAAAVQ